MRIRIIYILLQRKRLLDGATEKAPNPIITRKLELGYTVFKNDSNDSKQEKKFQPKFVMNSIKNPVIKVSGAIYQHGFLF